jgi:hypothetical protein
MLISNANLNITVDSARSTARCVVTCRVYFTSYERREMAEGLRFVLYCSLWGQDLGWWLNPDDYLYSYASTYFSEPDSPQGASFEATLGLSLLNEDWGTDEVYGKLTLRNLYNDRRVTAKTNVVRRKF